MYNLTFDHSSVQNGRIALSSGRPGTYYFERHSVPALVVYNLCEDFTLSNERYIDMMQVNEEIYRDLTSYTPGKNRAQKIDDLFSNEKLHNVPGDITIVDFRRLGLDLAVRSNKLCDLDTSIYKRLTPEFAIQAWDTYMQKTGGPDVPRPNNLPLSAFNPRR